MVDAKILRGRRQVFEGAQRLRHQNSSLRVLLASHNLNCEGAPRSLLEIGEGLNGLDGLTVEVLAPCDGKLRARYKHCGIAVTRKRFAGFRRSSDVVQGWRTAAAYQKTQRHVEVFLQRSRPDVVIANTLHGFYIVEAAARIGIPTLWIIRESYRRQWLEQAFNNCVFDNLSRAFSAASRVVFVCEDTRRLFQEYQTRANFVTLPKSLPPRELDEYSARVTPAQARVLIGADSHEKIILTLGTVCERKDQKTLVRAAARLRETRRDFACYIVGMREGSSYAAQIRNLARDLSVQDAIRFVPEIEDVRPYLRAADVFAFASLCEAASRVLWEAQACGLPIVTTPCDGTREVVREAMNENGNALVFAFCDDAQLAAHLETLLSDDARRARMAKASREVFDAAPTYDQMIARYHALICEVCRSGRVHEN